MRLALLLLAITRAAANRRGNECVPAEHELWLVATHHKTGTVLNHGILRDIAKASDAHVAYLNTFDELVTKRSHRRTGPHSDLLKRAQPHWRESICRGRIVFSGHGLPGTSWPLRKPDGTYEVTQKPGAADAVAKQYDDICGTSTKTVRAVVWLREPLPLILSGYFYHRRSRDHWLHCWPSSISREYALEWCGDAARDGYFRLHACAPDVRSRVENQPIEPASRRWRGGRRGTPSRRRRGDGVEVDKAP